MTDKKILRIFMFSVVAATLLTGAAFADDGLQPIQSGEVTYITGGIGDDERSTLEAAKKDYNLHIMSATKTGEFVSDTTIIITNKHGEQVLNATAGPLFYVKLPAGTYTVESTNAGEVKKQKVVISKTGSAHVHFGW